MRGLGVGGALAPLRMLARSNMLSSVELPRLSSSFGGVGASALLRLRFRLPSESELDSESESGSHSRLMTLGAKSWLELEGACRVAGLDAAERCENWLDGAGDAKDDEPNSGVLVRGRFMIEVDSDAVGVCVRCEVDEEGEKVLCSDDVGVVERTTVGENDGGGGEGE